MAFKLKKEDIKPLKLSDEPKKDFIVLDIPKYDDESEMDGKKVELNEDTIYSYIRVVNIRGDKEYQAREDEKVIVGYRDNPILGNKNIKKQMTMDGREKAIAGFKVDLESDLAVQGPIYQALKDIAKEIVKDQQKIALQCYCKPANCHLDLLVPVIRNMVFDMLLENKTAKPKNKI